VTDRGGALLLDTCAVIWIGTNQPLADAATEALDAAFGAGLPVYVSPITAWEVGMLASLGRLRLALRPDRWFQRVVDVPGVQLADMSPGVLVASSFLPGAPPRDPADRIIAATAREYDFRLVTRDRLLLAYGAAGHLRVLAC